jgi:hypothetical protein
MAAPIDIFMAMAEKARWGRKSATLIFFDKHATFPCPLGHDILWIHSGHLRADNRLTAAEMAALAHIGTYHMADAGKIQSFGFSFARN